MDISFDIVAKWFDKLTAFTILLLIIAGKLFWDKWYTPSEYRAALNRAEKAERERDKLVEDHARLITTNETLSEAMEKLTMAMNEMARNRRSRQ